MFRPCHRAVNQYSVRMLERIPIALIVLRAACAVGIILVVLLVEVPTWPLLILLWVGLISDIFDGVIARKLNVATAWLRRLDSQVDVVFWLSVLAAAVWLHGAELAKHAIWLGVLLVLEVTIYAVNFYKFGRPGATHAYSAKLFGLFLLAAFTELFANQSTGMFFDAMIVIGMLSMLDVLLIAVVLPWWKHDVPSTCEALRLRRRWRVRRQKMTFARQ